MMMQSLWMVVAGFLFALMGACVKIASVSFSTAEIVFYRSIMSLLLVFLLMQFKGVPVKTVHWRFQLWRGVSGFFSLLMHYYALSVLPLATAVTLSYTAPLFLAIYLVWFAKAKLNRGGIIALALGFMGVILLLRPAFHADQMLGELVALGSGMTTGLAYYNVRELGQRGENEERTVFYFSLLSAVLSSLWFFSIDLHPIDLNGGLILLAIGLTGTLAQLAMTRAYKRGNTLVSASFAYTTVIFASVFGMLFWHEILSFDAWLAVVIIIGSGILGIFASRTGK